MHTRSTGHARIGQPPLLKLPSHHPTLREMVRVHKSRDIISCSKLLKHKNLPPAAYIIAVIPVYHSLNRDQALADRSFNESTESVPAAGANSRTKRDFLSWWVLWCKVGRCGLRKMVFFEIFVSRLWILI